MKKISDWFVLNRQTLNLTVVNCDHVNSTKIDQTGKIMTTVKFQQA